MGNYMRREFSNRSSRAGYAGVALAMILLTPVKIFGQATANAATDLPSESEEPIVLSPFVVSSDRDVGYQASDTLAGTRIRTDLADVGSAITVLTKDFLEDIGAYDNESALAYTLNTQVGGPLGNYSGVTVGQADVDEEANLANPQANNRIRGLGGADSTRNYFVTTVAWDSYNVSRVDILRGPNAILFGLGSPSGIINGTPDPADFWKNRGNISVRADEFGSVRASLNYNSILIPDQLAFRFALLDDETKFQQKPAFQRDQRQYAAFAFRPTALNTRPSSFEIRANYELGNQSSNRPRSTPPQDLISPFFDYGPTGAHGQTQNQFTYIPATDGANDWFGNINFSGPVYMVNSVGQEPHFESPDLRTRGALNSSGVVQPNGGTTLIYGAAFTPRELISYAAYASGRGFPFASFGAYGPKSITDPEIFDFYNLLLDGDNKSEWTDSKLGEISVSHTFLNNQLGYEIGYFKEMTQRGIYSLYPRYAIHMDINERNVDNSPNPNVGRAYVDDELFGGSTVVDVNHHSFRAQVFAEYDVAKKRKGLLSRIAGRQRLTGVYQQDSQEEVRRNILTMTPDKGSFDPISAVFSPEFDQPGYRFNARYYLSGDLRGLASPAAVNGLISNAAQSVTHMLAGGGPQSYYYFDTTWIGTVQPGDPWSPGVPVPSGSYTTQSQNPANYAGWTQGTFTLVDAFGGSQADLDYATRVARHSLNDTDSLVAVYQGYFLKDGLVLTYGWREDQVDTGAIESGTGPLSRPDSGADLDPELFYNFGSSATRRTHSVVHTTNWSVVAHANKLLGDRLPINVSFFYNRGENFQPLSGRLDGLGFELPPPHGSTKEYGVMLSSKDQRYNLRVTHYKASVVQASSSANVASQFFAFEQSVWAPAQAYARALADPTLIDTYVPSTADRALIPLPATASNAEYQEYMRTVIMPSYKSFLDNLDQTFPTFLPFWTTTGTIAPSQGGPTDNARVQRPQSHSFTEDDIAKGWEFSFIANPTRNWRLAVNLSKTEAIRSNVPDAAFNEILNFMEEAYRNTPAGLMPRSTSTWNNASGPLNGPWGFFTGSRIYLKAFNGQPQPEVSPWSGNLTTNYSFTDGRLRGLGIGGSIRYIDKAVVGFPYIQNPGDPLPTLDLSSPYTTPSQTPVDLSLSFRRKLNDKITWRIGLNIRNIFGKDELIPVKVQANGDPGTYRIQYGRTWSVTNSFDF